MGWRIIVIWECSLHKNYASNTLENLVIQIKKVQNDNLHLLNLGYKVICCKNLRLSCVGGICILTP